MNAIAVGYARISDSDQSHTSIEHQCDQITAYCNRNNITLQEIFIEKGKSAFTFNRPVWHRLEETVRQNKNIKFLVVYHLDRFSRANLMDALIKMHELEHKLNIKVRTVEESKELNTEDLGVQLTRTLTLLFANHERQRIKQRTTDGIYKSLNSGRYCSMAPIGYVNSKDAYDQPLLLIDERKAPLIRNIFKLYNEGINVERVGAWARQNGFSHKSNSAIQRILTNCIYAGLVHIPAYKGQPEKFIQALHAPIVDELTFWTAYRRVKSKTHTVQLAEEVPLRGILHCSCGRKLTAGNSKSKSGKYYWYYLCPEHKRNFSAVKLHAQLSEILSCLSFDNKDIEWFRETITESIDKAISNKGGDIMRAKLELQKTQTKIRSTQERFLLQPEISMEVYSKVITELKETESRLENTIAVVQKRSKEMYGLIEDFLPLLTNIDGMYSNMNLDEKQRFLKTVFSDILYYENGVYRTPYIFPIFADKLLVLKQKGLEVVNNPAFEMEVSTTCARYGNYIEHLSILRRILIA